MHCFHRRISRSELWLLLTVLGVAFVAPPRAWGNHNQTQDLLNDDIEFSAFNLELRPYISQMPTGFNNIISMTTRLGDPRLYVTTQQGRIYVVDQNPDGTGTPNLWFNATNTGAGGVSMTTGAGQGGLQSIAFHPEFDQIGTPGYGKLFATMVRSHSAGANFLGSTPRAATAPDGVLAEWSYNHDTGAIGGYRELFRVDMPADDHPIKQARFNPYATPGDEDYGLLYMTHGDSNSQHSAEDYPQFLDNALGKMIRIDPLDPDGVGAARYSIPTTNPFFNYSGPTPVGHATVLEEIFAYGFRNPHNFSFNKDDNGAVHILVGNIGRANVEEVELAKPGLNHGWPNREGTFVERQIPNNDPNPDAGYISGVTPLQPDEADLVDAYGRRNSYPVAQFDHNAMISQVSSDSSIASGFVIRNGSDPNLHNQLIFNNFPEHDSFVYHADFDETLAAVTTLDPNDPTRDEPGELTQAVLHWLRLALDHDNNPNTPPQIFDDFNSLLNDTRNDTRYGEGVFGEMYISTKRGGGRIYLVTNSVPLAGDYNRDHVVDGADYTVWRDTLGLEGYHLPADGNGDGRVDEGDYTVWKDNFGAIFGSAAGTAAVGAPTVPEPASFAIAIFSGVALLLVRVRRPH
jgi:glucose/arabinose dehydrogenase